MRMLSLSLAVAIASASVAGGPPAAAQKASVVEREAAAREVANVMARRAILAARGDGAGVVGLFASKQSDVSMRVAGRLITGADAIRNAFGNRPPSAPGEGTISIHAVLSPIIEVAEDGKTAKGFWQSVGPLVSVRGGGVISRLSFENYGVDFIKEDGLWKIWHITLFPDLNLPMPAEMVAQFAPPGGGTAAPGNGPPRPAADAAPDPYPDWTPGRPTPTYPLPVPYRTFSETFSYGAMGGK